MNNRIRNKQIKFYVTPEEHELILKNFNQSKLNNLSSFLRKMAISGRIFEVNLSSVFTFNKEISAIGNNINQIARDANTFHYLNSDEINYLKNSIKEIKNTQANILNNIKVKR